MQYKEKVLVIGLDGATYKFIDPLVEAGKMPNVARIIDQGLRAPLKSTLAPTCAPAWASLLTGKNPGKHGLFDFFEFKKSVYKKKVIDFSSIKSPTLEKIISNHGRKVIVMNVPIYYPPHSVNGIIVSGMLTPPGKRCAYPESISRELYQKNYIIDVAYDHAPTPQAFHRHVKQMTIKRFKIFQQLLQTNYWNFSIVVFVGAERLQQALWKRTDIIEEIYIEYDKIIGELLKIVGPETSVIILSDHGYTDVHHKFYVNEWLAELNLLSKKIKSGEPSIPEFAELQFGERREESLAAADNDPKEIVKSIVTSPIEMLLKKFTTFRLKRAFPQEHLIINWEHTYAYLSSRFSYAININLKGREPNGIVEPAQEYEEMRNYIIRQLYKLKDPYTFDNVIEEVFKGEDVFNGPYIIDAPDIIFVPKNFGYSIEPDKKTGKSVISNNEDHVPVHSAPDMNGIFLAIGPHFKQGLKLPKIHICDIAPTVLSLLNIPIPIDMDGEIYNDLFDDNSIYSKFDIQYEAGNGQIIKDYEERYHPYSKPNRLRQRAIWR